MNFARSTSCLVSRTITGISSSVIIVGYLIVFSTQIFAADAKTGSIDLDDSRPPVSSYCVGNNSFPNLRRHISATINKRERKSVNHCAAIKFGVKACGGPKKYLVYSKTSTNTDRLKNLVRRYNRCDDERNRRNQIGSDCEFITRPKLKLQRGKCVAVERR